ncbi:Multidrug resistance protein MdtA [Zhongshania aliphaticivorans]|uniref:Multidrug resistance protein MdtA n=1 Tax=Zhongshania aliphaticivorans TaxID=1470434 RepID=A0A5S9Q914_9GAMM|nr:efflux RND transporter periplasmic adaptor subunit [Zhongshania aliphaticivorans]CAA0102412.1 Multidrug resistance protein MdtA [Zhongshania aliphaticivorans]CAA0114298.1 Multidrug resistance protein MdtA [Zhongshania aliphaticivorans]
MISANYKLLAIGSIAIFLAACSPADNATAVSKPPPSVKVSTLKTESIQNHVQALGTLLAKESIDISSNVTEKITALHFNDGDTVKSGQLLITLQQDVENAQLNSAKADLAEQERELSRLQGLIATQSAAQTEYDQRQTAKLRAESKIEEIKALLAERNIRAPFSGVMGLRLLSPGALVSPGTSITTLDDISVMRLDFQLPSLAISAIATGQTVVAHSEALKQDFNATISAIATRINPLDRSITARALINNPNKLLKPGMLMLVSLITDEHEAIMAPESALQSIQLQHYVWILTDEQKAERRPVELGIRKPGFVEILNGVSAGEQLIYEGYATLQPGATVTLSADNTTGSN